MDYLVRYETLPESFNEVLGKLDLPPVALSRKNASNHADWRSYYDDELIHMVTEFYQRDLDCFNYRFD